MVHLAAVHDKTQKGHGHHASGGGSSQAPASAPSAVTASLTAAVSRLKLTSEPDVYTTSVYGSRFAGNDLPSNEIPEGAMPKDIAYRLIQDHLSLDNNPKLK